MSNYTRKLNNEIEAMQFTRLNFDDLVKFTNGNAFDLTIEKHINGSARCNIRNGGSISNILENSYVVKVSDSEFAVYTKYEFDMLYEKK